MSISFAFLFLICVFAFCSLIFALSSSACYLLSVIWYLTACKIQIIRENRTRHVKTANHAWKLQILRHLTSQFAVQNPSNPHYLFKKAVSGFLHNPVPIGTYCPDPIFASRRIFCLHPIGAVAGQKPVFLYSCILVFLYSCIPVIVPSWI
jgi:hypothetical protein